MSRRPPNHVYRIQYRRSGWNQRSDNAYRYRFTRRSAFDFIAKLKRPHRGLSPVTDIILERVPLGDEWERVRVPGTFEDGSVWENPR